MLSKIGLSSAEDEYYAICGKSATGMGLQTLLTAGSFEFGGQFISESIREEM